MDKNVLKTFLLSTVVSETNSFYLILFKTRRHLYLLQITRNQLELLNISTIFIYLCPPSGGIFKFPTDISEINGVKTFSITAADRFLLITLNNNYAGHQASVRSVPTAAAAAAEEDTVTCISTECRCTVTVDYLIVSGTGQSNRSRWPPRAVLLIFRQCT